MNNDIILEMVKIDLGISADAYDAYLTYLIEAAVAAIGKEGIILEKQVDDEGNESGYTSECGVAIIAYAAFLYRKRKEDTVSMPRSLRWRLNNLLFSQKGAEA